MPRQGHGVAMVEGVKLHRKNRKRGCSSSSSASSKIMSFRLSKRAILAGVSSSRSTTPAPIWRTTTNLRNAMDSPSTRPVSARRLAATLWEMNEIPSQKNKNRNSFKRDNKLAYAFDLHSRSQSPSPSEKMGKSSHRRAPSITESASTFDSLNRSSFMDELKGLNKQIERRSTSKGLVYGERKLRLKDISNALTTSKELLKIISSVSSRADESFSGLSVISALNAELERARMQVNHLVEEESKNPNELLYLMKCFAEEKASWRRKEHIANEVAVKSVLNELEAERKVRRRLESLNKKLGNEIEEIKNSFLETVKELESEKRTREISQQMCDELARNVDEDKVHIRRRFDEKNRGISKLRKQLEVFLGVKRGVSLKSRSEYENPIMGKAHVNSVEIKGRKCECSEVSVNDEKEEEEGLNGERFVNKGVRRSHEKSVRGKVGMAMGNIWEEEGNTKRGIW